MKIRGKNKEVNSQHPSPNKPTNINEGSADFSSRDATNPGEFVEKKSKTVFKSPFRKRGTDADKDSDLDYLQQNIIEEVDMDFGNEEFSPNFDISEERVETVTEYELTTDSTSNEVSEVDSDFSDTNLSLVEEAYKQDSLHNEIKPILDNSIGEAVKRQEDKLKLEVKEVLDDEVGYRLARYEKRRRRRDFQDKLAFIVKGVLIFTVAVVIMGNTQLRTRLAIIVRDFGDLFSSLISNEETSSNKLVSDILSGTSLGKDLNLESTVETNGFNLNTTESTTDITDTTE